MIRVGKMVLVVLVLFFALCFFSACGASDSGSSSSTSRSQGGLVSGAPPVFENRRIMYYDAQTVAAQIDDNAVIQESDEPFTIVDFGPSGDLPSEIKKPSIYAVFSQPVVPLAKLGEVIREDAAVFTISPPLKGVYRWYGTKLLSFEPDDAVIPQQKFTVTVSERLQSLGGKRLAGNRSFEFETERLSVLTWRLGDGKKYVNARSAHPADARNLIVYFSYPVELDEISKWLEISGANRGWDFSISRPEEVQDSRYTLEQAVLLTIREPMPMDTNFTLKVLKGARSKAEYLGSLQDETFTFKTLDPFRFDSSSVYFGYADASTDANPVRVSLNFNTAVEEKDLEKYISIDGFDPLTQDNIEVYGSNITLVNLPFTYNTVHTVAISAELKDIMGRNLESNYSETIRVGDADSYVRIRDYNSRILEAAYTPLYAWEVQNPLSLKRSINSVRDPYVSLGLNTLQDLDTSKIAKNAKYFFMDELAPYLNAAGKGVVGMRWQYQQPSRWSDDVYTYNSWLNLQVTDLAVTTRYAYNKVIVWVTHLSDGSPAANAKVELFNGVVNERVRVNESASVSPLKKEIVFSEFNLNKQLEAVSDENGLCVFDLTSELASLFRNPNTSSASGFRIRVSENGGLLSGGDQVDFMPNNNHNHWRFDYAAYRDPFDLPQSQHKVFLFTDRGLYKSGETVTFRGIDRLLAYGEYKPYTGVYSITVEGNDRNLIAEIEGSTTATGGSYGSFEIPSDAMPGTYFIRYKPGTSSSFTTSFTVANFERLRFESSVAIPDRLFYLGEDISATLSATYLAGGALGAAPYSYYWTSQVVPFNPRGTWERWNFGPDYNGYRNYLNQGEGTLSSSGTDTVSQKTESRVEGAAELYRIEASVQDAARQQIAATTTTIVHPAEYYIASRVDKGSLRSIDRNASTSSARILSAGEEASLSWALVKPDGEFFETPRDWNGSVKAQLVRYEWKTARQAGVAGQVNLVWEKVEHIEAEEIIDQSELRNKVSGVIQFTPQQSGQWEVRLSGDDSQGRKVLTKYQFYVSGAGWVRWGGDDADAISITTDKNMYAPGETAL
ncbi:MAG: alpha-2-macroglobulin, partial [Treponema sp.]|nr:alpha-2-macroglobulin [Treponema sp.]